MPPDHIELYDKPDHDLLVILVVRQNDIIDILEKVNDTEKNHSDRIVALETHCKDAGGGDNCTPIPLSRKQKVLIGTGTGGGIITLGYVVLQIVEAWPK